MWQWLLGIWRGNENDTKDRLTDDDLKNWGRTVARADKEKGDASES